MPLTRSEQDALIEQHMPLARAIAGKAYRRLPNHRFEDILSAAYVGLTQAARKFDPDKKVPFDAYARIRIGGEIIDSHRKLHKTQYVNEFPPDPIDPTDWFKGAADSLLGKALLPSLSYLTDLELTIINLRFRQDMTMLQIGREVGFSESRVSQIIREALNKMRDQAKEIVR